MTMGGDDGSMSRAEARLGQVLRGKYRLDRVLGIGGMAVVYKATHRNEAEFAVKLLHPELSQREDVRSRFLREGKAANSVKHPGAVLVVDDDVAEDGAAFLVMELLHGAPVETLWEQRHQRLPVRAVLAIADQLLDVLAAAHAKGIVHRDIKPANLFVTTDGTLKVLDFGIARVRDVAVGQSGHGTGTGMLLGTPAFMAPEQAYAKASEIDGQTDLWAVGATLFTLLSGQSVHEGENAAQLMIRAATTRARSLATVVGEVPPVVAQIIDCALAYEKTSRWPNAGAMREAVERVRLGVSGELPSRAVLATLVPVAGLAETLPVDAHGGRPPATSVGTVGGYSAFAAGTPGPSVPAMSRAHSGSTTAQPVSSVSSRPSAPVPERRGRGAATAVLAAFIAAVLLGGGLTAGIVLTRRSAAVAPAVAVPSVAAAMPPPVSPAPATAPSVTASATPPVLPEAGPALAAAANTTPPPAHAAPPAPTPRSEIIRELPASHPPAVTATQATPAATPSCDPPTWTDPKGHVHIKPGC